MRLRSHLVTLVVAVLVPIIDPAELTDIVAALAARAAGEERAGV